MIPVVYRAVFNSAKDYPRLEWVLDDGIDRARIWQDDRGTRWHHGLCLPPDTFKRSTTVKCVYYDDGEGIACRMDVTDEAVKGMTEAQVKRHIIEDMVRRVSFAVFCPAARKETGQ